MEYFIEVFFPYLAPNSAIIYPYRHIKGDYDEKSVISRRAQPAL